MKPTGVAAVIKAVLGVLASAFAGEVGTTALLRTGERVDDR
jgi:hypothetical protein